MDVRRHEIRRAVRPPGNFFAAAKIGVPNGISAA